MRAPLLWALVVLAVSAGPALAGPPPMLSREPPAGQLPGGTSVYVDDHTCPAGEVKLVTGGHNRGRGGHGTAGRTRKCVPRPTP